MPVINSVTDLDLQPACSSPGKRSFCPARDKFDRAGGIVVHGLGESDGLLAHLARVVSSSQRRRRFLDYLLIAALDPNIRARRDRSRSMLVAEHLNLDVAGIDDELLDENPIVAERRLGFRFRKTKASATSEVDAAIRIPLPPPPQRP